MAEAPITESRQQRYDNKLEQEIRDWISSFLEISIEDNLQECLKDGEILCKLKKKFFFPFYFLNLNSIFIFFF